MINEHVFILRCQNIETQKYLFYYFFSNDGQASLKSSITGTAQGGLNSTNLRNIKIPLPPFEVQQKIVAKIEAVEKKERDAKEKIEGLKASIFSALKEYPPGIIAEICGISDKKIDPQDFPEKKFTYLGLEHIASNTGEIYLNKESGGNILSPKNIFEKGDVLYGKLRPYLNKVAEAPFDGICSTDILVLKTNVSKILKYSLLSKELVKQTSELMKGTSLPRIGIKDFLHQKIPLPPLAEQKKITAKIEKIETAIGDAQTRLKAFTVQKKEVLKKYL